ncbi:putative Glucosamine 6-phosphate N-acetyltransferase-like protein [Naja naja]|nr:putative Glucosamine 6-phosphate N-acetyltransferase-like protein [Naja naja]
MLHPPKKSASLWRSVAMMPAAIKKLENTPMYDPHLLEELDWTQNTATFSPAISPEDPGEGLVLRPLCSADINRDTPLKNYVTVVEDTKLGAIVATATLVIEHKFTHSCAKRGRIEDVVVSGDCRGKQLGKLLMSTLTLLSKRLNCYKITLECLPKNVAFYTKFGYSVSEENYMYQRFFN